MTTSPEVSTIASRYTTRYDGDELPAELVAALRAEPEAATRFDGLAPSHRREYARWIAEARRTDARERRAAQTVMRLLQAPAPTDG